MFRRVFGILEQKESSMYGMITGFFPIELVDILCSQLIEDILENEDENDTVEIENMLDKVFDDQ